MPAQGTSANRDPSRLRPGIFLYAAPGLDEPRFAETVVLLIEHGSEGSMGIVVNRPTKRLLHEALDVFSEARGSKLPLYWGGPVQPEAILALVRAPRADAKTKKVLDEVHLAREIDDVRAALAQGDAGRTLRVYSGYAGWGAGQLQAEVRKGTWVLDRADAASVFSPDPSTLWPKVDLILNRLEARWPGRLLLRSPTAFGRSGRQGIRHTPMVSDRPPPWCPRAGPSRPLPTSLPAVLYCKEAQVSARKAAAAQISRVSSKGQVTLPKRVREAIGVSPGDAVGYDVNKGVVTLRRLEPIDLALHAPVGLQAGRRGVR
ncbi:MAG TPA: YqgE/AlgH family protein [Vicinamibacteria bacterium]|nr:YqgE/AlgH family protein [Vicinamibacteria bacterium]